MSWKTRKDLKQKENKNIKKDKINLKLLKDIKNFKITFQGVKAILLWTY